MNPIHPKTSAHKHAINAGNLAQQKKRVRPHIIQPVTPRRLVHLEAWHATADAGCSAGNGRCSCAGPVESVSPYIAQDLMRSIVPRSASHSAAGMRSRTAQIKTRDGSPVL